MDPPPRSRFLVRWVRELLLVSGLGVSALVVYGLWSGASSWMVENLAILAAVAIPFLLGATAVHSWIKP